MPTRDRYSESMSRDPHVSDIAASAPPPSQAGATALAPPALAGAGSRWDSRRGLAVLIAGACIATAVAHWRTLSAQAIVFDDNAYLSNNPIVSHPSPAAALRAFAEVLEPSSVHGYYQPLSMVSLMLDTAMGGRPDDLRAYHRTNLALHLANTALLIVLLYQLFGAAVPAALVGLLFGVHPLTIESTAWVAERKTLLATLFALACIVSYVQTARGRRRRFPTAALVFYALGLLAKPTITPLPALLLILDYWPLGRLRWRRVVEKVPFFALAAVFSVITVVSQHRAGGVAMPTEHPAWRAPLIVAHNIVFYLYKWVWPANLTWYYPFPSPFTPANPRVLVGLIGTPLLLTALLVSWRRTRALVAGWLFFFVAILPTLGIIGFTYTIAADRFAYLPSAGLWMIVAWAVVHAWRRGDGSAAAGRSRTGVVTACLLVAVVAGVVTHRDLRAWATSEAIFRRMVALVPGDPLPLDALGQAIAHEGDARLDEAIRYYEAALRIDDQVAKTHLNLGHAFARQRRWDEATAQYERAAELDPANPKPWFGLGYVCAQTGRIDRAIDDYARAAKLDRNFLEANVEAGNLLMTQSRFGEAERFYSEAVRIAPSDATLHNNLGAALAQAGRPERAIACFERALQLDPGFVDARDNLARARAGLRPGPSTPPTITGPAVSPGATP